MNILLVIHHFFVEIFSSHIHAIFFAQRIRLIYKYYTCYTFWSHETTTKQRTPRVWLMGNEDIYRYRTHIQCPKTMGPKTTKCRRADLEEIRETRTSSRGTSFASTFVGICEAFCKINIVGQRNTVEHKREFFRGSSRGCCHFLHVWS